jgi:hypothetical protein
MIAGRESGVVSAAHRDSELMKDFGALCNFGGRLAGSGEDDRALDWALARLSNIVSSPTRSDVPYRGWRLIESRLSVAGQTCRLACNPLLKSGSTPDSGITAEVLDLGRGTEEDFCRLSHLIPGRITLVRHEYPFSTTHIHRRRKYDMARQRGAAAFLIANPLPNAGPLSGSCGASDVRTALPAAYVDAESARALSPQDGRRVTATLFIRGEEIPAKAGVVIADFAGKSAHRVVLSAHIDGHNMAESALDNATGVATALACARALAPYVSQCNHGLRVCFFSAEEWALTGSAVYLDSLAETERRSFKLNINLDTVAGDDKLTALISEFPALDGFVRETADQARMEIATYLPLMSNSDHYNFARYNIPALRLVAGFDRPDSRVKHILSRQDTRDKVNASEMYQALAAACALVMRALQLSDAELESLAQR